MQQHQTPEKLKAMNGGLKTYLWTTFLVPPLVIGGTILFGSVLLTDLRDEPVVRVGAAEKIRVAENAGKLSIPITCEFPHRKFSFLPAKLGSVAMRFSVVPGTAAAGRDFIFSGSTEVVFGDSPRAEIALKLLDSKLVEGDRSFRIRIEEVIGAKFEGPETITVEVEDDESPSLAIDVPSPIEVEDFKQVVARVQIQPPFAFETRLICQTRDGDAVAGRDYSPISAEVVLPAERSEYEIELLLKRSSGLQLERQFFLSATLLAAGEKVAFAECPIRLRFPPQQGPTIHVADLEWRVTRDSRSMAVPVKLTPAAKTELAVRFVTKDGTARAGIHYEAKNELIVFRPGEDRREVAITLLPREPDGSTVSFQVEVLASGQEPKRLAEATIVLRYPQPGPILEVPDVIRVSPQPWEKTTLRVPVRLRQPPEEPCSVDYETVPGEAKPPQYTSAKGRLVFDRGDVVRQIQLEIVGLPLGSRDQDFRISFSNPQNLRLSRDQTVVMIEALQGLSGSTLVVLPFTNSLEAYWDKLMPQLARISGRAGLLGGSLWIVDGDSRLFGWREGKLPEGLKIEDQDFVRAFNCCFAGVESLQRAASASINPVIIVWVSELNPDYGDLGKRVTVPADHKYQVVWVRESLGGQQRVSRRLSYWFGEAYTVCVDHGEVGDAVAKLFQ